MTYRDLIKLSRQVWNGSVSVQDATLLWSQERPARRTSRAGRQVMRALTRRSLNRCAACGHWPALIQDGQRVLCVACATQD